MDVDRSGWWFGTATGQASCILVNRFAVSPAQWLGYELRSGMDGAGLRRRFADAQGWPFSEATSAIAVLG
jgi:hypothetical protein